MWAGEFSVRTSENYTHLSDRTKLQNNLMSSPAFEILYISSDYNLVIPVKQQQANTYNIIAQLSKPAGGRGGNQAYSPLSTTRGHITNCKLDSVVYVAVYA